MTVDCDGNGIVGFGSRVALDPLGRGGKGSGERRQERKERQRDAGKRE